MIQEHTAYDGYLLLVPRLSCLQWAGHTLDGLLRL